MKKGRHNGNNFLTNTFISVISGVITFCMVIFATGNGNKLINVFTRSENTAEKTTETESEVISEVTIETELATESESVTETELITESELVTETELITETETESETETEVVTETETESETETEVVTETETEVITESPEERARKREEFLHNREEGTVLRGVDESQYYYSGQDLIIMPVGYKGASAITGEGKIRYIPYSWMYAGNGDELREGSVIKLKVADDTDDLTVWFDEQVCKDEYGDRWESTNNSFEKTITIHAKEIDYDVTNSKYTGVTGSLQSESGNWTVRLKKSICIKVASKDSSESVVLDNVDRLFLREIENPALDEHTGEVVAVEGSFYEENGKVWIDVNSMTSDGKDILHEVKDDGYTGHTYQYVRSNCTWEQAYQRAKEAGGYLLHLDSKEEYDRVVSEISARDMNKMIFFIGARREKDKREYRWINSDGSYEDVVLNSGSYWGKDYWLKGEPTYRDDENKLDEYYLEMFWYSDQGKWVLNDVPNDISPFMSDDHIGYIIEFNAEDGQESTRERAVAKVVGDEKKDMFS